MMRSLIESERSFDRHEKWLAKTIADMQRHYNKQEGPEKWDEASAVEFLVRDLFEEDPASMKAVVEQCRTWLRDIHGVELPPMRRRRISFRIR
jgi:hypothetical protein